MVNDHNWNLMKLTASQAPPRTRIPRVPLMPSGVHTVVWEIYDQIRNNKYLMMYQLIESARVETSPLNKFFNWGKYQEKPIGTVDTEARCLVHYAYVILGGPRW